jgi:hypothetical protein
LGIFTCKKPDNFNSGELRSHSCYVIRPNLLRNHFTRPKANAPINVKPEGGEVGQ